MKKIYLAVGRAAIFQYQSKKRNEDQKNKKQGLMT